MRDVGVGDKICLWMRLTDLEVGGVGYGWVAWMSQAAYHGYAEPRV